MQFEINNVVKVLKKGGLIIYPTDTVWSIGCDATNGDAVNKIYKLLQIENCSALTCLIADDRMLKKYITQVPTVALNIIEVTDKPTTIIFDEAKNLAQNLIAKDGTIAIRIPDDEFCYQISRKLNGAIISVSANIRGYVIPKSFKEISQEVLKGVDYVVNLHHEKILDKPSLIIKLSNNGIVKVIRG